MVNQALPHNCQVMVVEDSDDLRSLLTLRLQQDGYKVIEANDGQQALDLYDLSHPDLVLLDIMLPVLDGLDTCVELRQRSENLPILMLTSLNDAYSVERAFEAGADDYITKPMHWPVLRHRVYTMIKARRDAEALRQQKELTYSFIESSAVATFVIDNQHRVVFWNKAVEELTGKKASKMIGSTLHWSAFYSYERPSLSDLIIDNRYDEIPKYYRNFSTSNLLAANAVHAEGWFPNLNGHDRYVVFEASAIYDSAAQVIAVITTLQDFTEQKKMQEALQSSQLRYQAAMHGSIDAFFILKAVRNETGVVVDFTFAEVNPAAERQVRRSREELLNQSLLELYPAHISNGLFQKYAEVINTGQSFEDELPTTSPGLLASWLWVQAIALTDGDTIAVTARDISERKQAEEELAHHAFYDALTGLPNRLMFSERLRQAQLQARRNNSGFTVAFLDLNRFKQVNDTLGHDVGDLLLQEVAHRLRSCLRVEDTVARMGGDEFTLILPGVNSHASAETVVNKIHRTLQKPFQLGEHCLEISASIGVSRYPDDSEDVAGLIKHSDKLMYAAKHKDREGITDKLKEQATLAGHASQTATLNLPV